MCCSTRFVVTLPPAAGTELAAAATAAGEEEEVLMKLGDSEDTQDSSEGTCTGIVGGGGPCD